MKWTKEDLQQYSEAKEYVDTAIIPLLPFQLSDDANLEHNAFQRDMITLFTRELEKELTGRVVLTPDFAYLATADKKTEMDRLHTWVSDIRSQPFSYIFFVTLDSDWKTREEELEGTLLWLQSAAFESIKSNELQSFMRSQVQEITKLIRSYWKKV
ncbi:YpiF family protein [Barrientosiimonas marina]|uniref:DUF2487 family protein n=1 Tax=Lentibacillus kimchii TaxID=1542911 RepID=A0ABW2V0A5_9BACI